MSKKGKEKGFSTLLYIIERGSEGASPGIKSWKKWTRSINFFPFFPGAAAAAAVSRAYTAREGMKGREEEKGPRAGELNFYVPR